MSTRILPPDIAITTALMEPASPKLMQRLQHIGLNPQSDLNDCRSIVRRLAKDLPTFDSVWIDALVQLRRLTPFQAKRLEAATDPQLRIGPVVIQQPMEPGEHCRTFDAKHLKTNHRCVIKTLNDHELVHQVFDQLEQLTSKLRLTTHPSIIGPNACLREDKRIVTVSRIAAGRTVHELMVRRGRFSPRVVAEIGRQLIEGLATLEAKSLCHGDISLVNVRLTDSGYATIVDAGIRPITESNPDLHTELPLRKLEGLAPERIGTANPVTSQSDIYALGCLFWRLLCGRPIFLTADPMALIAAHKNKDIIDVREWAPDTPKWMAELIHAMTQQDPDKRPTSFANLAKHWGKPQRSGRRQLKKFHTGFNRAPSGTASPTRLIPLAAAALMVAAVFGLWQTDSLPALLKMSDGVAATNSSQTTPKITAALPQASAIPVPDESTIPQPDATGHIQLTAGRTYQARNIVFAGHLQIESSGAGEFATIVVHNQSMTLSTAEVTLHGVRLIDKRTNSTDRTPALILSSQSASIRSASFESPQQNSSNGRTAIQWQADDNNDRSSGRISVQDCIFQGSAAGLDFLTPPAVVSCDNILKAGSGPLVRFSQLPQSGRECQMSIRNSTLRKSGALLQLVASESQQPGLIALRHANCVFAIASNRALIETYAAAIESGKPMVDIQQERSAEASLLSTGIRDATWLNTTTRLVDTMPNGVIRMSGLTATELKFTTSQAFPENCVIKEFEAPRLSALRPGIDAARLAGAK